MTGGKPGRILRPTALRSRSTTQGGSAIDVDRLRGPVNESPDSIGKLRLPEPPAEYVPARIDATRVRALLIDHAHALQVSALPRHHRDPFDRLLIAQAQLEDLTILTADPLFDAYDVTTIAAS